MNEAFYEALIRKKLTSTLNVVEQHSLENWLSESVENQKFMEAVEEAWNLSRNYENTFVPNTELALEKLKDRIRTSKTASTISPKVITIHKSRRIWSIAAAVMLILGVFSLWELLNKEALEWHRVATIENVSEEIILADGTQVWLNKGSELKFPKEFGQTERKVILNGEAFFQVVQESERRFIIESDKGRVEVLGTSFNLKARAGEPAEISVKTGKVAFSDLKNSTRKELTANTVAKLENGTIDVSNDLNLNALSWHTGHLSFNNTPLQNVLADMQKYFNINIEMEKDNMNACRFTSPIVKSDLNLALKALEKVFLFKIDQTNPDSILLTGGKCN